ncbi:hypothetical protein [Anaeromicropila populeti]|nr:hypothetical protein [Anaeromicropila populeti]
MFTGLRKNMLSVFGCLVELTEDVLPLGSLVQLKTEYFRKL